MIKWMTSPVATAVYPGVFIIRKAILSGAILESDKKNMSFQDALLLHNIMVKLAFNVFLDIHELRVHIGKYV